MPVTAAKLREIALSFPGALEKPSYGRPAFFIEKKFFTRLRSEDASIVIGLGSIEQRDMMLELDGDTYHITDHYKDYPYILVRLTKITPAELEIMLERRWRQIAPKKLIKESAAAPVTEPMAKKGAAKKKTAVKKAAGKAKRA